MSETPELTRRELKMPWYVEKWYDGDLEIALIEAGIPVSDERIAKLRDACTGIFDDLSDRTELLKQKAEELFENETNAKDKDDIKFNYRTENLMEIAMEYERIKGENEYLFEKLTESDSTSWKAQFVDWANEFETVYAEDGTYPEKIKEFARKKILEFAESVVAEVPDEKES